MAPVSSLRLLVAAPLLTAVVTLGFGAAAVPGVAADGPAAAPAVTASPTREPRPASASPTPIVPIPVSPRPSATRSERPDEPTASPTRTRVRTATPRPRRSSASPVRTSTRTQAPPSPGDGVFAPTTPGFLDTTPTEAAQPTTAPVAASTSSAGSDRITRLIQLVLAAGVLLGIGGGVGLYLTRH